MLNTQKSKDFEQADGTVKTLKINLLPAKDAVPMAQKLAGVLGGVLGNPNINIAEIVATVSDKLDIFDLTKTLLKGALVSDAEKEDFPIQPESYFTGNYGEMIDFLAFALEANFSSFFASKMLGTRVI